MPFEILRNDITNMAVDAIVNSANPRPVIGAGTDSRIHEKAGPELLEARRKIGVIPVGRAAATPAFQLKARYVIHTVGPVWRDGTAGEERLLRSCYDSALKLAEELGCRSVAFPLISSGNYGFPKDRALQVAISAFSEFLLKEQMQIYLVVYDRDSYRLSEQLFSNVASYIEEHLVTPVAYRSRNRRRLDADFCTAALEPKECMPMAASTLSLEEYLRQTDKGFTEKLLELIDQSGKKDSQIYRKANLSKQHFSKIRKDPHYRPTKPTAVALALALELDLEQTRDLIGRAGYALSASSKFDLIVQYFIEQRIYNVVQINLALYEFDQEQLGQ